MRSFVSPRDFACAREFRPYSQLISIQNISEIINIEIFLLCQNLSKRNDSNPIRSFSQPFNHHILSAKSTHCLPGKNGKG